MKMELYEMTKRNIIEKDKLFTTIMMFCITICFATICYVIAINLMQIQEINNSITQLENKLSKEPESELPIYTSKNENICRNTQTENPGNFK